MKLIEVLVVVLWACFATYATWYLVKAEEYAPLSREEVRFLWRIHRRDSKCQSFRWREIVFNGRIVGFECECGHRYVQKRPIALREPSFRKLGLYNGGKR
ncbi:MAG: hypothetical protein QXW82_00735 [Candidatus Bathyarchaeia archaeon]